MDPWMCTLQLEKDIGGMAHPNLKDYYRAAQLRPAIKWCAEGYTSKWKDIERAVAGIPTQSLIGSAELIKSLQDMIDPKTLHALSIWFDFVNQHKLERDLKLPGWFAYDDRFKPSLSDHNFRHWGRKGPTAISTLTKNGNVMNFQELKTSYGLENRDHFRYLWLK